MIFLADKIFQIYVIRLEMTQRCNTDEIQYFKLIASWVTLTINFAFYPYDQRYFCYKVSQNILGNSRKSYKILEFPRKSQKTLENTKKFQKSLGNPRKAQNLLEYFRKSQEILRNSKNSYLQIICQKLREGCCRWLSIFLHDIKVF